MEAFAASLGVETVIDHSNCHHNCRRLQTCPTCSAKTVVGSWHGRWDQSANGGIGGTAMPFDPVAITLACGCSYGDLAASMPRIRNGADDD
jgi:hypothetical protein